MICLRRAIRGAVVWVTAVLLIGTADAGVAWAQTMSSTVTASSTVAAPVPKRPKRRARRSRRRRRRRVLAVRPPTPKDRFASLQPLARVEVNPSRLKSLSLPKPPSVLGPRGVWNPAWGEALWAVLWVLAFALICLRLLAWMVRRLAARGVRAAQLVERGWRLIEGLTWIAIGVWILDRLASGPGFGPAAVAAGGMILVVTLGFNAIRDVVAGLLLNLERPFEIGDYVRVAEAEGQVHAFRTRVVELIAPDGHRLFVPYRALAGTTNVRPGGRRRAYSVRVTLAVPEGVDPTDALAVADEVARASPWATLATDPRITVANGTPVGLEVEAFAFDAAAQSMLHTELLRSWTAACRRMAK